MKRTLLLSAALAAITLIIGCSSPDEREKPATTTVSYLYVPDIASDSVSAFSIGIGGALTAIPGTFSTGSFPDSIAISPNGNYLYAINYHGNSVSAFSIGGDGALSAPVTVNSGNEPYGASIVSKAQ
jgi:6-phosphogluconolactonase (cycloisomerase 2 family)